MKSIAQEVDALWRAVKPWGRFQIFQLSIILLDFGPACFTILSAVFTGYIPKFECDEAVEDPVRAHNSTNTTDISTTSSLDQCEYTIHRVEGNNTIRLGSHQCNDFSYSNTHSYASDVWELMESSVFSGQSRCTRPIPSPSGSRPWSIYHVSPSR